MIAAMMTAANFNARVTGWGFAVFTVGSICWSVVGALTGQTNLLATNGVLTLVNLIGVWRWLGKQQTYEEGGKSAEASSRRASSPTLFTATGIAGMPVQDKDGEPRGKAVEALLECRTGQISYIVVATGDIAGIYEQLRAVPRGNLSFGCDYLTLALSTEQYEALPVLTDGDWPAEAQGKPAHAGSDAVRQPGPRRSAG
jgi:hypothetical protein